MVDVEVVQTVVLPEGQVPSHVQELDDGIIVASRDKLQELRLREAVARLGLGLADGDLDGGLGVAARHQPGEVDILGGAVQPDESAPGRADLDVGVLDLLPVRLHLERPVVEVAVHVRLGERRLQQNKGGLVVDVHELLLGFAHSLPEGEGALPNNVDELKLLRELLQPVYCCQYVAVGHSRGRGAEGEGVTHQEGAGLLVDLRCLGELDGQARPLQGVGAGHRDGDLVGEAVASIDGGFEGCGVQPALGGDLDNHLEGVGGGAVHGQAAAAIPLLHHRGQGARRCRGNREAENAGRAALNGVHGGVGPAGTGPAGL